MEQKLNKIALITGGTRGIGKAIAIVLAQNHIGTLLVSYLENDTTAEETRLILTKMGITVHLLKYNLAFSAEINALFEEIGTYTKQVDFFVHCAALTTFKPLHTIKTTHWDLTMNISARSFLQCAQKCLPLMAHGGSIVAISSTGSQRYNANYGALGVAKTTLESIVRYLAVELAEKNIRVNGVVPGLIMGEKLPPFPQMDAVLAETMRRTPAGRLGTPQDIAEMVYFILTKAHWLYGQNIILDGGYCLT